MSRVKDDVVNSSDHIVQMQNDQTKSTTTSKSIYRRLKLFKRHFYTESQAILLLSLAAVSLDPLFFYIPVVKNASTCLGFDNNLRIIVVVFRSFVDVLHTILWWHHSLPLLHGYRKILAWTVAILAILPLPQVVIYHVHWQPHTVKLLKFVVLYQIVLRLLRIIPAYKDATRTSDHMLHIYTWFAAAFNLIMYTIASNVLGGYWYIRAVERHMACWKRACYKNATLCGDSSLYCDVTSSYNGYLYDHCSVPPASSETSFDYGISDEAFQTVVMKNIPFLDKFFHCLWWGLRTLSSLGQNLEPGTYIWDSFVAICIAICGLVLFAFFIGNMQVYLQTKSPIKWMKMKQRKKYLEEWNPFDLLPEDLREEVICCEGLKCQEIAEVNLESLLNNISMTLGQKVRPHLCKDMFSKIPKFGNLRNELRGKLCNLAKPLVFSRRSHILREGEPIHELVFVVTGNLLCYSKHSTQARIIAKRLSDGCFFGEELFQQLEQVAQDEQAPNEFSLDLPIASKSIQAITKVEAFALPIEDLREVFVGNHA